MDKILFRKHFRKTAAKLGILRPLRTLVLTLRGNSNQSAELDFHRSIVSKGDLVFDVGANRGQSSELYIKLGAKVVAFEPQEDLHPEIRQLCKNSTDLTIVSSGLGSREETRRFFIAAYDQVASLREDWEESRLGETIVNITTLDKEIQRFGVPAYCKIDVKGWENEVVKGLSHPLPIISFEFHNSEKELPVTREVLSILAGLGAYQCNIRKPGAENFLLDQFIPIGEFSIRFPNDLPKATECGYADIFCFLDSSKIHRQNSHV
jgi:FkbM family methyltransferase